MAYALWVRSQIGPSGTGPEDVIAPLPVPWLGLRADFPFGDASLGMETIFLDGRAPSPSAFLLKALLTDLGADESPSFAPFISLSSFLRAAAALILYLATSISTK